MRMCFRSCTRKMKSSFTNAELEAFLDEALPTERMTAIEEALRNDEALLKRLTETNGRRDAGVHSLGEIWRRHRLSCPSREQLGSYLLNVLDKDLAGYIRFHLETSGCRTCLANLEDLKSHQVDEPAVVDRRRKKYFQSSAGHLRARYPHRLAPRRAASHNETASRRICRHSAYFPQATNQRRTHDFSHDPACLFHCLGQ